MYTNSADQHQSEAFRGISTSSYQTLINGFTFPHSGLDQEKRNQPHIHIILQRKNPQTLVTTSFTVHAQLNQSHSTLYTNNIQWSRLKLLAALIGPSDFHARRTPVDATWNLLNALDALDATAYTIFHAWSSGFVMSFCRVLNFNDFEWIFDYYCRWKPEKLFKNKRNMWECAIVFVTQQTVKLKGNIVTV